MKKNKNKSPEPSAKKEEHLPGYPHYPAADDIYSNSREETDIDPDDPSQLKAPNVKPGEPNKKDFKDDVSGNDLDIPGSELDDEQENTGNEDEENNHYSLGDN